MESQLKSHLLSHGLVFDSDRKLALAPNAKKADISSPQFQGPYKELRARTKAALDKDVTVKKAFAERDKAVARMEGQLQQGPEAFETLGKVGLMASLPLYYAGFGLYNKWSKKRRENKQAKAWKGLGEALKRARTPPRKMA